MLRFNNYQQQLPLSLQSQVGSVPLSNPLMIPAAQPTPDLTLMAPSGQFIAHAPHSMHKSLCMMDALLFLISKTACGQTKVHIRHPLHNSTLSSRVTTSGK
jgi:hypothetical protein